MKNSQCEIRKLKKEIEEGGFNGLIMGRSKSQQEIDTRIGRLDDEFQNGESPDGIHELEREADQNSDGLRRIWPGNEYLDRRHIPQVAGGR